MKKILLPHDIITIIYILLTVSITIAGCSLLEGTFSHFIVKSLMLAFILAISFIHGKTKNQIINLVHNFYPLLFLGYFYGETGYLNNLLFNDLDPYFRDFEQKFFGFQPSLEFSEMFPQKWFNELMNFGYFSYYFLTITICVAVYIINRPQFLRTIFIVITSFFIYYLIFIIFPVIGPQFYFIPPLSKIPDAGFFREAVKFIQSVGEQPTGAFPSSHVGMALIFLYLAYIYYRKLFVIILPLVVILMFATVYIKAHYLVDVIGGVISAPVVLYLSMRLYKVFGGKQEFYAKRKNMGA